jgi:LPS-assembly protein
MMFYNENFTATVLGRSQANRLFEVVERKPEMKLEFKRQPIPGLPGIYYEGEASVVNFERNFDREDNVNQPYRSVRYDMFHQLLYPKQYFHWLNITPRVGARGTIYTRNNNPADPQPDDEISRYILNAGAEASFKLSKTWLDAQNENLGIDGIRHVAEPFINFSYSPKPNVRPDEFRGFDNYIPSLRLPSLNYPAFQSIDSLDQVTTLRHGIRNKIQTKRDGINVDLIDWVLYADLDLEREQAVLVDKPYSQLYNDLTFEPVPWLKLEIDSSLGLTKESFNEVNSKLTWQVMPALEATVGNRYLNDAPLFNPTTGDRFFPNSNLLYEEIMYRLNENWKFSQQISFEADNGKLEEQRYTIYRDLTSWNLALTGAFRDNKDIKDEFIVYLSLTLKAFPEQSIGFHY